MNLFHLTILLVVIVATTSANPQRQLLYGVHGGDGDEDSHEIGEEQNLPQWYDDDRFNLALDRLTQAASNLILAYPLASVNDYASEITNDVFANYDLFGYGPSQLFVREADNNLKGHHAQYHHYEHL